MIYLNQLQEALQSNSMGAERSPWSEVINSLGCSELASLDRDFEVELK
jgi:hypothetical protein